MKKELMLDDRLGCFGDFKLTDPICRNHCALNLRCAAEHAQDQRMALLEEWFASEEIDPHRMQ